MSTPAGVKMPHSLSAGRAGAGARRAGAGDAGLHATPARTRPHVRKQLFLTPVNKFTVKPAAPSAHLERIKSCLDQYTAPRHKIKTKAASMEDLTPTKRIKREKTVQEMSGRAVSKVVPGSVEQRAAARVARFMLLAAWRRRRHDVRLMRKTLEFQVSCSERLRLQVSALKYLLESDTAKVRMAMRELERLRKMMKDKEEERALLEKEKTALEKDVSAAEDRASEMSIGWRNSRNELENTRAAAKKLEQQLKKEQDKVDKLEGELSQHKVLVRSCQAQAATLRRRLDERGQLLQQTEERLAEEIEARAQCSSECECLRELVSRHSLEARVRAEQAAGLQVELRHVRDQLDAWPAPLTRCIISITRPVRQPAVRGQVVGPAAHVRVSDGVVVPHARKTRLLTPYTD
ncbi:unnamed protein product [Danaus chrysippus]|uniref:(African queen) hypothetical protein n=1 Tax=Danaus chrysippus TaxID=151541 RepID=A0A8J2R2I4_9NEOP|nr:unnamed protein product [Danaus chrysippus]